MLSFFRSGATLPYEFRKRQLQNLKQAITDLQGRILAALEADLGKSKAEGILTETGFSLNELDSAISNLKKWMKPEKVSTNFINLPGRSYIRSSPKGIVLIISPWNYPFQLLISPLIGAIAAGNCAVVKPSEAAPATAAIIDELIKATFPKEYINCVLGEGKTVIPPLIDKGDFSHIFYTGSTEVGREISKMAAPHLITTTLELGGKSPCIVTSKANLKVAARRIVMAKFTNAGQTCVAPDYILAHPAIKHELILELVVAIQDFYGETPEDSWDYGKIVNKDQFDRLAGYLQNNEVIYGGQHMEDKMYIQPTLVNEPAMDNKIMEEEIFGPILPIISYTSVEHALEVVAKNPNPLALYIFTENKWAAKWWLKKIPAGGACINNCMMHLSNPKLPFGGRGDSGMGNYHGHQSFLTFSHQESVLSSSTWLDPNIKYPPYKSKTKLMEKITSL